MRRRLAILAAVSASAFALALALSASPALASPVQHQTFNAPDFGGIVCGPRTYAFSSGQFFLVFRDPSVAAHITAVNVRAEGPGGKTYSIVGAETYNDPIGHLTAKLMVVSQGVGIVDSINIVFRSYPNGNPRFYFDRGTCGF